jgi:hypothetical protein
MTRTCSTPFRDLLRLATALLGLLLPGACAGAEPPPAPVERPQSVPAPEPPAPAPAPEIADPCPPCGRG